MKTERSERGFAGGFTRVGIGDHCRSFSLVIKLFDRTKANQKSKDLD
jgi:hypothetical protein